MEKILYLEGASGISGDMTVGALLDLGGSWDKVEAALSSMPFGGYAVSHEKTAKWGLSGTSFSVHLEHCHHHSSTPSQHHHHHHEHRNLADVLEIVGKGKLSERARALVERAFTIVAEAEAKAHGTTVDEVHFHEVGAVDSICDIVAAAVLADDLGVRDCAVTGLSEGSGLVECAHGALPVPVPAVLNIAEAHGIPLRLGTADTELVTPTGIALAAALRTRSEVPAKVKVLKTGIGFGTREIGRANCLRAMLLEPMVSSSCGAEDGLEDEVVVLETNVDDATGEQLGIAMEALFAAGARDCHFSPCFMKKNRPGWLVRVIADESLAPKMEEILFRETTTIGVRRHSARRATMRREEMRVPVAGGEVLAKKCAWGGVVRVYPEADSVNAVAARTGRSFAEVFAEAKFNAMGGSK